MAQTVIPVAELAKIGVVYDTPPVSLASQAFTDVSNVRFRDGAVRKFEGEVDIQSITDTIVHVAWWPSPAIAPSSGYYVVITDNGTNHVVTLYKPDGTSRGSMGSFSRTGEWNHTLFAGGYAIVINNGVEKPHYILDNTDGSDINDLNTFGELPGWDSYEVSTDLIEDIYTANSTATFDLGQELDFSVFSIKVTKISNNTKTNLTVLAGSPAGTGTVNGSNFVPGTLPASPTQPSGDYYNIYNDTNTNTTVIVVGDAVGENDQIKVTIESRNPVTVTCGIIKSFNNLLVAGDLVEKDGSTVVRRLTGVVRTSDLAVTGAIPNNWNPFAAGVSTADEFTLSETDPVVDMVQLQGNLFIYTHSSIHRMQLTGNQNAPVSISTVTNQYGAQTKDSVIEFDGQHLVVGSNDIYVFTGNPSNIQSVANGRVRDKFYEQLSTTYENRLFLLRNNQYNEIWICFPTQASTGLCDKAYIWNFRDNTWTVRTLNNVRYGVYAPVKGAGTGDAYRPWGTSVIDPNKYFPVFAQNNSSNKKLIAADIGYQFSGSDYVSYIERKQLAISPEYDTETINSIALHADGSDAVLRVRAKGTSYPGQDADLTSSSILINAFTIQSEYKIDARVHGRLLNMRIDDAAADNTAANSKKWNLAQLQLGVNKGGSR